MVSWGPYILCLPLLCMILTAVELPDYDDKEEVIQLLQRIPQELQLTQIRHHHLQRGGGTSSSIMVCSGTATRGKEKWQSITDGQRARKRWSGRSTAHSYSPPGTRTST